ncbi:diacylglycerol kinase [Sphingosinicella sp. BN140058]|nr:diacylglycerol kinase [Sphingosinicella sp. BN140058]
MDAYEPAAASQFKNRPFRDRLGFALRGVRLILARERSFRAQALIGLCALGIVGLLQPGFIWAALVALSAGIVLAFEAFNAALEYAIDRLHPEVAEEIRHAKDAAAGAVLIASVTAVLVGAMLLASSL